MSAFVTARRALLAPGLAVAWIAVLLAPGFASAANPRPNSVTVTGSTDFFTNLSIDVSSGSNGENPTGRLSFDVPSRGVQVVDAAPTCLDINGRFASIGVPLPPAAGFEGVVLTVADNGPANSNLDMLSFGALGPPPSTCPEQFGGFGPLMGGDAVVTDDSRSQARGCSDPNQPNWASVACNRRKLLRRLSEDSVTGGGDFGGFTGVAFNVRSGRNGGGPTGFMEFDFSGFGHFEVTSISCLTIRGGAATFAGTLTPSVFGLEALIVQVSDNEGLGVPDGFSASPAASVPATCATPHPFTSSDAIGDIVVLDAGFDPKP